MTHDFFFLAGIADVGERGSFFEIFAKNRNIHLESSGLLHSKGKSLYFMRLEGFV